MYGIRFTLAMIVVGKLTTRSRVSFLLHGVEHRVAILSLVLVQETNDSQLSVIFILCVHITKSIIYCVYFQYSIIIQQTLLFQKLYLMLFYMITMPTHITCEQLILYYTVIYYFIILLL